MSTIYFSYIQCVHWCLSMFGSNLWLKDKVWCYFFTRLLKSLSMMFCYTHKKTTNKNKKNQQTRKNSVKMSSNNENRNNQKIVIYTKRNPSNCLFPHILKDFYLNYLVKIRWIQVLVTLFHYELVISWYQKEFVFLLLLWYCLCEQDVCASTTLLGIQSVCAMRYRPVTPNRLWQDILWLIDICQGQAAVNDPQSANWEWSFHNNFSTNLNC